MRGWLAILLVAACAGGAVSCRRDPQTTRQRFFEGGERYLARGRYREALVMYRNAIKTDPRFASPYYQSAQAMLRLERPAEAVPLLRRAVELLPEGPQRLEARRQLAELLLLFLGSVQFDRSVYQEARQLAEDIREREPRNLEAPLLLGRALILRARHIEPVHRQEAQKVLAEAIAELRQADALTPGKPEVVVPLAKSLWGAGDANAAAALLEAHLREPQAEASAFSELSRLYQSARRYADAARVLEQGIARQPGEPRMYASLARLYAWLGKQQELRAVLAQMELRAKTSPEFVEPAGVQYLQAGLAEDALRVFDSAAATAAADRNRYRILAIDALIYLHRIPEAKARNEVILRENVRDIDALVRRASFAVTGGQASEAIPQLEHIIRLSPQNAAAMYHLGRAFAATGNSGMARHWLAETVRTAPALLPARLELIRLLIATGEYGEALSRVEAALELEPGHLEAELLRAATFRLLRRYDQAWEALGSLRQRFPEAPDVLLEEGLYFAAQGETRKAEEALRRSHRQGNLPALLAIAELRMAEGKLEEARRLLSEESLRRPDNLALRAMLAQAESQAGRPEQAASIYESLRPAVALDARSKADLYTRLGELHRRQNQLDKALGLFEEADRLWPDNAAVLQNLAVTLDMSGKRDRALPLYERSLALRGENAVVLNNLAFHIAETGGDLERALTYAQRARQLNPSSADCLDTLGWIYVKKGLYAPALDIYGPLVQKHPDQSGFRYRYAVTLGRQGATEEAAKQLTLALESGLPAADAAAARRLLAEWKAAR